MCQPLKTATISYSYIPLSNCTTYYYYYYYHYYCYFHYCYRPIPSIGRAY